MNKEAMLVEIFAALDSVHSSLVSAHNLSAKDRIQLSNALKETAKKVDYFIADAYETGLKDKNSQDVS